MGKYVEFVQYDFFYGGGNFDFFWSIVVAQ